MRNRNILRSFGVFSAVIFCLSAGLLFNCGGNEPPPAPQATATPTPQPVRKGGDITLIVAGQTNNFKLKEFSHIVGRDGLPDQFIFKGEGITLIGKFPQEFQPAGDEETIKQMWSSLINRPLGIYAQTSLGTSEIQLEGFTQLDFQDNSSLVIDKWAMLGEPPLSIIKGRLKLHLNEVIGNTVSPKVYNGTFKSWVTTIDAESSAK